MARTQAEPSGRRANTFLLVALLGLGSTSAGLGQGVDFHHDFRGRALPETLVLFGDGTDRFIQSEAEGLRISLPKDRQNRQPVGVQTTFSLQGDFESTVALEILQAERPAGGIGVGASMYLNKADQPKVGATIFRLVRSTGKEVVMWDRAVPVADKMEFPGGDVPCSERVVRLRLQRTGSTLTYAWAAGVQGDDFHTIQECEFGADDIKQIVLRATTTGQPSSLDVRFIDLRIRSGAALRPAVAPDSTPPRRPRSWLFALLLAALGLTLLLGACLGCWLYVRRRGGAKLDRPDEPS